MAYEKKDGDIAVFYTKVLKNERSPRWTGEALINGQVYKVALWEKTGTMLAGKIEPKTSGGYSQAPQPTHQPRSADPLDDEIPF